MHSGIVTTMSGTPDLMEVEPFPVMGVTGRMVIVGATEGIEPILRGRLDQLESRWSRFRSDSDISRINSARGAWTAVSRDTLVLLRHMQEAHRATEGAFNPTLLPDTVRHGDARSRARDGSSMVDPGAHRHHDLSRIEIDASIGGVRIPAEMALDPGGIAKGLAADIVAEEALRHGAAGACVNVGGDLRCIGEPPNGNGWRIDIRAADDFDRIESTVWIEHGAVATSTPAARTWVGAAGPRHHIIDPSSGEPTSRGGEAVELASIIAERGAWAEVFTKGLLVLGWSRGSQLADGHSLAAFAVDGDGRRHASPAWQSFVR